jgi:hypothetical protein
MIDGDDSSSDNDEINEIVYEKDNFLYESDDNNNELNGYI